MIWGGGVLGAGDGGWKKGYGWPVRGGGGSRAGYLLLLMEADLTGRHAGVLVEVRPGRVDDRYVVLFVAYIPLSTFSFFLRGLQVARPNPLAIVELLAVHGMRYTVP